jgi:hypothetical protein
MKKRIFSLLGILIAFIVLFSSCGLTEIEQSQEDYNYNKIVPKVVDGIQGASTAIKTNTKEYSLNYFRGGSTWTWSSTGCTVVPIDGSNGNEVDVFFNQDSLELGGPATISVFETTLAGVVSETVTKEVMVSPFVISVSGPSVVVASGAWVATYSTAHDAGATYAWSVVGHTATLVDNADGTATVTWDLSATDIADVGVRCVKTYVGLESVADTATTDLVGYLAKTRDDFAVALEGEEFDGTDSKGWTNFTATAGTEADELIFPVGNDSIPALFIDILTGWGELFVPGYGNDGDIIVTMDMATGEATIEEQDWGVTDWGLGEDPVYHYGIKGTGYWDGKDMTIHLTYKFLSAGGSTWYTWNVVLGLD